MNKSPNPSLILHMLYNLLGFLFLLFIIGSVASLAKFLYFPSHELAISKDIPPDKFSKTISKTVGAGHFHILDETVYTDIENAPICLQCHGNFCHVKSEKLRSFYNMHTFFLACETCHIRKKEGEDITFKWFDDKTGDIVKELKGENGNFGAKLVPVKDGEGEELKRLDEFPEDEKAIDFIKNKDTYTAAEKKNFIEVCMKEHISEKAIECEECHQKNGYFDYKALGYDPVRSAELSRIEIVQMSKDYDEFYLPTMFDPNIVDEEGGGS